MTLWPPGVRAWRVAFALVGVLLAGSVLPRFPLAPDLLAVLVVSVGVSAGPVAGAAAGLGVGWLLDLVPPGGHPLGAGAISYLLVGLLGGFTARWWRSSVLSPALTAAAAAAVVQVIRLLSRAALGAPLPIGPAAGIVALTALLGALLLPPLVAWQRRLAVRRWR